MEEIEFSKFRARYSALIERMRKTREPIRVIRRGVPLAEIVPVPIVKEKDQRDSSSARKKAGSE